MAKLVSKTYADALFEAASDASNLDLVYEEAQELINIFNDNPKFLELVNSPKISKTQKLSIVEETFQSKLSSEMLGLLNIVMVKDRMSDLRSILDFFIKSVKEFKLIGIVDIVSAYELSEETKTKIENKILSTTKYKSLECNYEINQELIAGLKIRIGDKIIDSTVQSQIATMTKDLYKLQLV